MALIARIAEPEKLTVGVTWKWKMTISDYPAREWTLSYYLRKDGISLISFAATADGDTHVVTVSAATSSIFGAGQYDFIGVVAKGSGGSAEKHGVKNKIMQRAVRSQTRNLRKRAEAAIKYAAEKKLTRLDAFVLRVLGNGHRYIFTVRTESGFDKPIYQYNSLSRRNVTSGKNTGCRSRTSCDLSLTSVDRRAARAL